MFNAHLPGLAAEGANYRKKMMREKREKFASQNKYAPFGFFHRCISLAELKEKKGPLCQEPRDLCSKKVSNVSLNLLFLILSAPVESSWEKDLGFPKEQEEGKHVRRQLGERERERG